MHSGYPPRSGPTEGKPEPSDFGITDEDLRQRGREEPKRETKGHKTTNGEPMPTGEDLEKATAQEEGNESRFKPAGGSGFYLAILCGVNILLKNLKSMNE